MSKDTTKKQKGFSPLRERNPFFIILQIASFFDLLSFAFRSILEVSDIRPVPPYAGSADIAAELRA